MPLATRRQRPGQQRGDDTTGVKDGTIRCMMQAALKQEWVENEVTFPDGNVVKHRYGMWPKQKMFHMTRQRYVCFGGARGPGKTRTLVEHILATMLRWEGIPILVCRKDLKDLKSTFLREWIHVIPKEFYSPEYGGQYHKGENWFRFFNGSLLQLGELKDWESYKSATLGMVAIDEANEVEEDAFVNLDPTLRWTTGKGLCKRPECAALGPEFARDHSEHPLYQIVMATNPAPGWVKQRFWEPWKSGHERPRHAFISATAFDNPSLPPDFIPTLMESHNATWVQNYVYGDWSAFENMVWERFSRGTHDWKGPIPYGSFVRVEGGIDYGGTTKEAHRTAAYLTGVLPDGRMVTFWEYSKQGGAAADFFAAISQAHRAYRVQRWWADASQHRANELLRTSGIEVQDAPRYQGAVKDGINLVDNLLTPDATGRPQLYVACDACPKLAAGIETYQLDPDTGLPTKNQEDDEVNAWRYNIMCVSQSRTVMPNRELRVVGNGTGGQQRATSSIIANMRDARRARMKAVIDKMEREALSGS